jgi:hypothetical protein
LFVCFFLSFSLKQRSPSSEKMNYSTRSQMLFAVLQDVHMPAPKGAVLPSRGLASQSGCTYRQLQATGAGAMLRYGSHMPNVRLDVLELYFC